MAIDNVKRRHEGFLFLMPVLGTGNKENGSGHESLALHLYHFE